MSGLKLKEINIRFSLSESGVTQASRRVREKMGKDREIAGLMGKSRQLSMCSSDPYAFP